MDICAHNLEWLLFLLSHIACALLQMVKTSKVFPVFVKRPESLLTDNTNKFRRNVCSSHHSLRRRLNPLDWKQEIHSLSHPAVFLSIVVVLKPIPLGEVHVAAVATVFSVRSKNCGFLFAQAVLKEEGRGRSCSLTNATNKFTLLAFIFLQLSHSILVPFVNAAGRFNDFSQGQIKCKSKEDGQHTSLPT